MGAFRVRDSHPLRSTVPSRSPIRTRSRSLLGRTERKVPQPQPCNPCRVSHMTGLASSGFARHYYRNHMLFSLPEGTEMFHFPPFPLPALYIQAGVTRQPCSPWRGFPIRKSSDHSSFINSPRLIADYDVLLRLQMPRHPPFALRNLKSHK